MVNSNRKKSLSPARNALSILLFVIAGALLAVAIYLFWQDRNQETTPSAPTAVPGQAQLKTVHDALAEQDLDVEYGRESARIDDFTPVGQELVVNGQPVFVFIFNDSEQRESEMDSLEPDDLELTDNFGDPLTTEPLFVAAGSNVAVVTVDSDDDLTQSIEDAVATIP